jgi:hypothetical protein
MVRFFHKPGLLDGFFSIKVDKSSALLAAALIVDG